MKKMVHITHNDLDGVGCAVVGKILAENMGYDYEYYCSAIGQQDTLIQNILKKGADFIMVSDLPISEETASKMDKIQDSAVRWIDHHVTAVGLGNRYSWATVIPEINGIPVSATWLIANMLTNEMGITLSPTTMKFSDVVSRYDTWEWKKRPTDFSEEDLNIYLRFVGIEKAFEVFYNACTKNDNILGVSELSIVETIKKSRQRSIEAATKSSRYITLSINGQSYKVAVMLPSGEYGNAEMTAVYEIPRFKGDFVLGLYPNTKNFAFRAAPGSKINLSNIAKAYGGGGHPTASGARVDKNTFLEVLGAYYDSTEYLIPLTR